MQHQIFGRHLCSMLRVTQSSLDKEWSGTVEIQWGQQILSNRDPKGYNHEIPIIEVTQSYLYQSAML